jgi:hypothetical protein
VVRVRQSGICAERRLQPSAMPCLTSTATPVASEQSAAARARPGACGGIKFRGATRCDVEGGDRCNLRVLEHRYLKGPGRLGLTPHLVALGPRIAANLESAA